MSLLNKLENLIQKIDQDKKFEYTFLTVFLVLVMWWAINIEMGLLGFICLLIYWFIVAVWLGSVIRRVVGLSDWWSFAFGIFLAIYLTGFGLAGWIVLYKISVGLMMTTLMLIVMLALVVKKLVTSKLVTKDDNWNLAWQEDEFGPKKRVWNELTLVKRKWWVLVALLTFIAINLLFDARTGDYILSLWERVRPLYIYLYLVITFFVLMVIFSRQRLRTVLIVIILHSFLLHSYLPIVYRTGFGGDKWRHVAAEKWLDEGNVYSPSLFGEEQISYKKFGPLKIPEVLLIGNKTSYANQWGLTMLVGKVMSVDFFGIDYFLGFILWSIFIPLFLFKLGQFFAKDRLFLGFLTFMPSLFYPLQVYGAITLPVAFGFLYFVFMLILWLTYLSHDSNDLESKKTKRDQFNDVRNGAGRNARTNGDFLLLLFVLTGLMYFNYLIYFILILMIGGLIVYFKKLILLRLFTRGNLSKMATLWFLLSGLLFFAVIPVLDRIGGVSRFKTLEILRFWQIPVNILEFILGKLFGLEQFIPQPFFISQGNFIFMQIWESLSSSTIFTFADWPAVVSIFIWLAIIFGIFRLGKIRFFRVGFLWVFVLAILLFSHFVSMYYMEGVRLVTKRFDLTVAFFMMLLATWGIYQWLIKESRLLTVKAKILVTSLVLAVFSGVVYASGPKLEVVTEDEWAAAKYVIQEIAFRQQDKLESGNQSDDRVNKMVNSSAKLTTGKVNNYLLPGQKYCVLGNTWPLLALEMESGRKIVGGGFPIYIDYAQPGRVELWERMTKLPSFRYMQRALDLTGANFCYFMVEKRWLGPTDLEKEPRLALIKEMFGEWERVGDVYIFFYGGRGSDARGY